MKVSRLQSCVDQGLCTWDQVRETLKRAHLSEAEIARYMEGRLPLGPYTEAMIRELVAQGKVPDSPTAKML
ncbi:MAG TPA: hypothetical protein VIG47_05100 [Gemmatimonadaceae bacterium]|jgi:hypothetical protein